MNAERKNAWRNSRKAFRYRLPAATLREIREKLLAATSVTTEIAEALDREYGLREKFGIPQPLQFLVREREAAEEAVFMAKLKVFRRRQIRTGKYLKKSMGKEAESARRLWEDSTYLNLVEKMYVRLMDENSALPTEELTALSKSMAEHRRASVRDAGATEKETEKAKRGEGEVPADCGEAVKQVYGTNFQGKRL